KALEDKNAGSVSSFRPMSARLEVIAHLNAQALTELDENTLADFSPPIGRCFTPRKLKHSVP
ncbi:MAG: hypothetical protein ACPHQD_17060, partial [Vibrio toranzoniae]